MWGSIALENVFMVLSKMRKKVHMGNFCLITCEKDFQSKNH